MNISFTLPLNRSWARMRRMLFQPFALEKWLVLAFAAFLSEGMSHFSGKSSMRQRFGHGASLPGEGLHRVADFLAHPVWGAVIIAMLALVCVVVLLLMWVNSRGRFVFLDDVVRERAAIVEPWHRYADHGNSLFVFTLASLLVCGGAVLLITLPMLPALLNALAEGAWRTVAVMAIGGWLVLLLPLGLVIACFFLFLHQFVVPLMLRHDVGPIAAWGRFLGLFWQHPFAFIGFAVAYLLLSILVVGVLAAVGFATCCIGFILFAVPYVGSVVLLPIEVVFRGYGPEFLSQFGPEYSLFEAPAPPVPPA